jgi:hypothetical protein
MTADRRGDLICRIVLLFVWLALWAPRLTGPINFRWDASAYYVLGTALAEGKGYRLLNEPGEIQAVQYPPLLPMIVAAHQRVMGTSDYFKVGSVLRLTYFVLSGLFLLMAYAMARKLLSPSYALLVGVITALSFSSFLGPSDVLYAEMPFAVAVMGFLLCHQRRDRPIFAAASGILGAAAYLLRTAGLALLLAWIAESLICRRFRQAMFRALVSALPILLWQGYEWKVTRSYDYNHPTYSYQRADYYYPNVTYSENSRLADPFRPELGHIPFRDLGGRLARNAAALPEALGESAVITQSLTTSFLMRLQQNLHIPLGADWPTWVSGICRCCLFAVGLLALSGAVLAATGEQWFVSLYFGINLGVIVITPWQNQFWRYLAPMAPITLVFVFLSLATFRHWLEHRHFKWERNVGVLTTTVAVVAMLLIQIAGAAHLFRSRTPVSYYDEAGRERVFKLYDYGSEWHPLDSALEWIRRNTGETAVIATTVPHLAFLRTAHKAVLPPFERDPNTASRLLDEVPVTCLVLDTLGRPGISERYLAPVVAQRPQDWRLVFTARDGMTRVYERAH